MVMEVMDSLDEMKSIDPYDICIYLWKSYRDPRVSPFPKDLLPIFVAPSSPI